MSTILAEPTTDKYAVIGKPPFFKIVAKLGNMRKAHEWLIHPKRSDGFLMVSCSTPDAAILINPEICKGAMRKGHYAASKLGLGMGGDVVDIPELFIKNALEAAPGPGPFQIT